MSKNNSLVLFQPDSLLNISNELNIKLSEHDRMRYATSFAYLATKTPGIASCTEESVKSFIMNTLSLGLDPHPQLGEVYPIPRINKNINAKELNVQLGYKGLAKLVKRAGEITSHHANVVYKGERFVHEEGLNQRLEHTPSGEDRKDENIIAAYAVATKSNGEKLFEVLYRSDIERIRNASQAKDNGPWAEWYSEMCKKSALRRLMKNLDVDTNISTKIDALESFGYHEQTPATSAAAPVAAVKKSVSFDSAEDVPFENVPVKSEYETALEYLNNYSNTTHGKPLTQAQIDKLGEKGVIEKYRKLTEQNGSNEG